MSKADLPTDSLGARAERLLDLPESDFGQSGRDVRIEAIRAELERNDDTARLDFVEHYLGRQSFIQIKDGGKRPVYAWAIVTQRAATDSLRQTIDTMMGQKKVL